MDTIKNLTILAYRAGDEDWSSDFQYKVFPINELELSGMDVSGPAEYIFDFNNSERSRYNRHYDITFLFDGREAENEEEWGLEDRVNNYYDNLVIILRQQEKDKAEEAKRKKQEQQELAEKQQYEVLKKKFEQ